MSNRHITRPPIWATVLFVVILLLVSLQHPAAAASASPPSPAVSPSPLTLPTGHPGGVVRAPLVVYSSNASYPLNLIAIHETILQDKTGDEIPASAVSVTPALQMNITKPTTLSVEVSIPTGTKAGNYSGQLILVAENGAVAAANINLSVTYDFFQYFTTYWLDLIFVVVGVLASFVYSPLADKSSDLNKANEAKKAAKEKRAFKASEVQEINWKSVKALKLAVTDKVHGINLLFCVVVGLVAFVYVFSEIPGLGTDPYRAAATALIDGFTLHRVVDGTSGDSPKTTK